LTSHLLWKGSGAGWNFQQTGSGPLSVSKAVAHAFLRTETPELRLASGVCSRMELNARTTRHYFVQQGLRALRMKR